MRMINIIIAVILLLWEMQHLPIIKREKPLMMRAIIKLLIMKVLRLADSNDAEAQCKISNSID